MKINELIEILDQKLKKNFKIDSLKIEDKSFLHAKHKSFKEGKFHIKLILISDELKLLKSIDANKKIYAVLKEEMNDHIHSHILILHSHFAYFNLFFEKSISVGLFPIFFSKTKFIFSLKFFLSDFMYFIILFISFFLKYFLISDCKFNSL